MYLLAHIYIDSHTQHRYISSHYILLKIWIITINYLCNCFTHFTYIKLIKCKTVYMYGNYKFDLF